MKMVNVLIPHVPKGFKEGSQGGSRAEGGPMSKVSKVSNDLVVLLISLN